MFEPVVSKVIEAYGLDPRNVCDVQKGYRNESYPVVLKNGQKVNILFYKNEPDGLARIIRSDDAATHLSRNGMPVRVRFDPRLLKIESNSRLIYVGVYNYMPGSTIPWEAYTKDHIKLLGWAMSDMHACWKDFSPSHSVAVSAELEMLIKRMQDYFKKDGVIAALRRKLGISVDDSFLSRLLLLVRHVDINSERQPLHMDMVRGNVLFAPAAPEDRWKINNTALSGVIDFEKTAIGSPLFDIARTLAFLMVDCTAKTPDQIMKYFLRSGYNRRGQAIYDPNSILGGRSQSQLLSGLISLFLLHDFYKFLLHTPYESLPQNHHFVRTRDILARYNMVRYV